MSNFSPGKFVSSVSSGSSDSPASEVTLQNVSLKGTVDSNNSTAIALTAGQAFTGSATDVSAYPSVVVACKTDKDGSLYVDFSPDGTNWDSTLSFSLAAGVNEVHRISVTRKFYRARVHNTSVENQTYLRLQTLLGAQTALTSPLNGTIQSDSDSLITRSVLMGQTGNGSWNYVPVTAEGHLETVIHGPRNPFGSIHVERMHPIFQVDAVYGINDTMVKATTGSAVGFSSSGDVSNVDNKFVCSTGTSAYSFSTLQSDARVRYRPGQGTIGRVAGLFSPPVANSINVIGFGSGESGFYFGYNGTSFGILYSTDGVREIQSLNILTASTTTNAYQVFLPNGYTASVPATNNSSTSRTAYEITLGTFPGWNSYASGSTVVFLSNDVGNKGLIRYSQTGGGAATGSEVLQGVAATDTWVPQTQWNGDKMDGSGSSGILLDPTKGNVYQIGMQYLGFGGVVCQIEANEEGNNPDWTTVHTFKFANSRTVPTLRNPSFPFTMAAYSAGSTTNISCSVSSFAGFIEGDHYLSGPRFSYIREVNGNTITNSQFNTLMSIRNDLVYKNKANQCVVNITSLSVACNDASSATVYLIREPVLVGSGVSFRKLSNNSIVSVCSGSTSMSYGSSEQVVTSVQVVNGNAVLDFPNDDAIKIQPGETIGVVVKPYTTFSAGDSISVTINTREDQ